MSYKECVEGFLEFDHEIRYDYFSSPSLYKNPKILKLALEGFDIGYLEEIVAVNALESKNHVSLLLVEKALGQRVIIDAFVKFPLKINHEDNAYLLVGIIYDNQYFIKYNTSVEYYMKFKDAILALIRNSIEQKWRDTAFYLIFFYKQMVEVVETLLKKFQQNHSKKRRCISIQLGDRTFKKNKLFHR